MAILYSYEGTGPTLADQDPDCQRVMTIPGIGFRVATRLVASVGDARTFENGRQMAAWVGLVPRQWSTGGKTKLLGISKRGDSHLRSVLIHGARAVLRYSSKRDDRFNVWIDSLKKRRNQNVVAVAAANKMVRIAWALLVRKETFKPRAE